MLKTLVIAGALAALGMSAAHAQPRWPYEGRYYAPRQDDDDDGYRYQPRYQDPRDGYGYGGAPYVRGHPAYDEYGPDPNGLRAPDGHRIKCKLVDQWDGYTGRYIRRRACW